MAIPPIVHPAIPATAHLIPGIKQWASTFIADLSRISIAKLQSAPLETIKAWYTSTDPLHSSLSISTGLSVLSFVIGELTLNGSTVDRMWAALPWLYSAHFAFHGRLSGSAGFAKAATQKHSAADPLSNFILQICPAGVNPRMFLVFLLYTVWSARLTGNTIRRGFFDFTSEDYRWPIVRKNVGRFLWGVLDLTFIAFIQNYLLLAMALPQYFLLTATRAYHPTQPMTPFGWQDWAITGLFFANIITEQIADSQQQAYQNWKHDKALKEGKGARMLEGKSSKELEVAEGDLRRGFVTSGLWAYSRHPNFLCEQLNFWTLTLFTWRVTVPHAVFTDLYRAAVQAATKGDTTLLSATARQAAPHLLNYAWFGAIALTILFNASTLFTESISSGKYPKYRAYQRRVGMFLPTTTILKSIWLTLTGNIKQVNDDVFGSGKSKRA